MALPWLVAAAVIAAGTVIYNAVKDDDSSDDLAEKLEAARKAQKEKDRLNKKKEIIGDIRTIIIDIYSKHHKLLATQDETINDDEAFFLKLKNTKNFNLTNLSDKDNLIEFLNKYRLKPIPHFNIEKEEYFNDEIFLLNKEIETLDYLLLNFVEVELEKKDDERVNP